MGLEDFGKFLTILVVIAAAVFILGSQLFGWSLAGVGTIVLVGALFVTFLVLLKYRHSTTNRLAPLIALVPAGLAVFLLLKGRELIPEIFSAIPALDSIAINFANTALGSWLQTNWFILFLVVSVGAIIAIVHVARAKWVKKK